MPVCAVCKTNSPGRPNGLFFHAVDDWRHIRLFLCSTCLANTPLQHSIREQCFECSEPPPMVKERQSADEINPRFTELCTAIKRFEGCHRETLCSFAVYFL